MRRLSNLLVAAVIALASAPALAKDKITIAMNWNVPYSGWAGFYVALAKGYYDAEGLDMELLLVKGSNPANQAVAAGSADMAVANASAAMVAKSKGLPLTVVAAHMQSNPEGVITRADSNINALEDFVGKKVAINPANPTVYLFESKLARAGVDKSKIEWINVQPEAMVPLIVKGEVDAGLGYWDWQAINVEKEGVPTRVFVMSDDKVQIYGNVILANSEWLEGNGDRVTRFLRASVKGWIDAFDNVQLAHDVMMEANPEEDPEFLSKALAVSIQLIGSPDAAKHGWGHMDAEDWQGLQDALLKGEVISDPVDIDALFTNEYLPNNIGDWGNRQ